MNIQKFFSLITKTKRGRFLEATEVESVKIRKERKDQHILLLETTKNCNNSAVEQKGAPLRINPCKCSLQEYDPNDPSTDRRKKV